MQALQPFLSIGALVLYLLPTMVAAFTTDIPALSNWGQPFLVGPGSIHVAHTEREGVEKAQLEGAVTLYCQIARELLKS